MNNQIIMLHQAGIPPTKMEIKQAIIQRLLDIEYAPSGGFYEEDREAWDTERQMLVMRCGWNTMSVEELLANLK